MSKLSQQVENQLAASDKVVASARTHSKKIAAALAERAAIAQAPGTAPDAAAYEAILLSFADQLDAAAAGLRLAELAYTAEQADDVPARAARDIAHAALAEAITHVRSLTETALGREALKTYGLHGETPRKPHRATLNHVDNVIQLLEKKPVTVKTDYGMSYSTADIAAALKSKHTTLADHMSVIDTEARELEAAMIVRDRAAVMWSEVYQGVANALTGMYRIAGWVELAERVRPTQRILRGEDAGPEMSGAGEAPAESAAPASLPA